MLLLGESEPFKSGCFCLEFYLTDFLLRDFIYKFCDFFKKQKILRIGFKHWEVLIGGLYYVVKTFVIIIEGNYKLKLVL